MSSLQETVSGPCEEVIANRYPFGTGASQDVPIGDFARLFGPAGLILGPVVFTVTRLLLEVWRRPTPEAPPGTLGPTPDPD